MSEPEERVLAGLVGRGRLEGRVALIVGGAAGIGRAAAVLFAREGARIALADISDVSGQDCAASIRESGGDAVFFHVDVTREDSVKAMVQAAIDQFGDLHVLFNCAGGSLPQDAPVTEVDLSVWERTMSVDVLGTMLCCRHAIPWIVKSGGGAVVNMSSGAALLGTGRAHSYIAAKGAVNALTRALAGTYAKDNVRVNAICAGRVNTERVRQSYGLPGKPGATADLWKVDEICAAYPFWLGEPEDVANIGLFLASNESRMITGAEIPANGGRSAY